MIAVAQYGFSPRLRHGAAALTFAALALVGMTALGAPLASPLRVVALGDSITAGLGLPAADAFPTRLQSALQGRGLDVAIDNAGVSGDTAAGGLARLDWSVPDGTQAVLLELGANDMLRGTDPAQTRGALDAILARLKQRAIPVMILGMRASPALGPTYTEAFDAIYPALAKSYGVPLDPFFLDGVALQRELNQGDGIHPNARGVARLVERLTPEVETFLRSVPATR